MTISSTLLHYEFLNASKIYYNLLILIYITHLEFTCLIYMYTLTPQVSKSWPNAALKLHEQIETIKDLIGALYLENFKLRLPVTDQTFVIFFGSLFEVQTLGIR